MEFRVKRILASVFTPDLMMSNSLQLANIAQAAGAGRFTGQPLILPLPQDAPPEIPRIKLSSQDEQWGVEISLARTILIYAAPSNEDGLSPPDFSSISAQFFNDYIENTGFRVQRLSLVIERFAFLDNASAFLVKEFCKEAYYQPGAALYREQKFELHAMKQYQWQSFPMNSWIRLKASAGKDSGDEATLTVLNDFNTSSEEKERSFGRSDISNFFINAPDHIDDIIKLYFKKEQ